MATGTIKNPRDSEIDALNTQITNLSTRSSEFFTTSKQVVSTTKTYTLTNKGQYLLIVSHPTKTDVGLYLIDAYNNSGSKVAAIKASTYATVSVDKITLTVTTTSDVFVGLKDIGKWSS